MKGNPLGPGGQTQVGEDLHDHRRRLDGGDDLEVAPTLRAVFQVQVVDADRKLTRLEG